MKKAPGGLMLAACVVFSMLALWGIRSLQPASAAAGGIAYGFTAPVPPDQAKLNASHVGWVRQGLDWSSIETSPGVYDFGTLDRAVAQENAAGIQITVPLQDAPGFRKNQVCNGVNLFPGPSEMSTFASVLAARYNGRNGHGYVQSFEIGNEEYDGYWSGSWDTTSACRTPNWYGPVLKAGYQAIKASSPNALVGMFGLWWQNSNHILSYMTWLYQNGYGRYMDFANFHYYSGGDPSVSTPDVPSYAGEWQMIHGVMAANGDGAKPIWCTEVGWAVNSNGQPGPLVNPAQQSQYLQEILDSSRTSGVVQAVFIYTLMDNDDGMNIWPPSGPLPAYNMLESYIAGHPGATIAARRAASTAAKPAPAASTAPSAAVPPSASARAIIHRRSWISAPTAATTQTVARASSQSTLLGFVAGIVVMLPFLLAAVWRFRGRRRPQAAAPTAAPTPTPTPEPEASKRLSA